MKSSFFTTVSHELKTPLSLIVAPLRSIARQELNTDSQKHLDTAIRNTRKMEELINELVTFNKIETANFPFYVQRGNAVEFVELAVEQFRDFAAEKQIALSAECENNGEEVWFSPSYVERIVNNLLTNALKFTPRGGAVRVQASISTLPGDPSAYLQLVVSDTGIGIAKEELPNIFERYYQTKRGYNVDNGGWGIGLSLVKRLVEIHQGTVSVESEVGQGTAFTVRLNVSADAFDAKSRITDDKTLVPVPQYRFSRSDVHSSEAAASGQETPQAEHPVSILIVDDNPDMLQFLASYFSSQYNVLTAANGAAALQITAGGQVELVVSDVMMPGMDGTELCRRLKQDVHTSHIPVILLTAKGEQADVLAGYESGAEAYVSKPFDPQILELQIKNILQLRASRQQEIANGHEGDIDAAQLSELDKKFLHQINALIDANIGNSDFSIAEMTAGMGISRTLLHTKMKNLMGISAGDYLRKRRMDRACKLLREGYNVSETAYKTGFADPNYFSKAFRKHTGKSPTEFLGK
jgi:DNA-binding response OmpR family regulator/two-component sensor histidine kinase